MQQIAAAELRPEVASEVPEAPNPVVERAIVLATRDLCEAAPVWQETLALEAVGRILDLHARLAAGEVVRLMARGLTLAGEPVPELTRPDGPTLGYYATSRRILVLSQTPSSPTFEATVQVRPAADALEIPEDVAHDYRAALVAGAVVRLLLMAHEPWASAELAKAHAQTFTTGVEQAKAQARRIHTARSPA